MTVAYVPEFVNFVRIDLEPILECWLTLPHRIPVLILSGYEAIVIQASDCFKYRGLPVIVCANQNRDTRVNEQCQLRFTERKPSMQIDFSSS